MGNSKTMIRFGTALAVIAVALAVYFLRPATDSPVNAMEETTPTIAASLPRLLDLGADKCVPCKMMAPILEELKVDFAENFTVEFIDVWKFPDQAKPYGIKVIPTQIFFDGDGTEMFRHEGFYGREDILAKWQELGLPIPEKTPDA